MSKQRNLTEKLSQEFRPHFFHIENESHRHSVNRDGESHFKIVLVSDKFDGLRRVARHKLVYQCLAQALSDGIHALALHTFTLSEWQARNRQIPSSTDCLGGGH
ncbi:transcriptional regulator [Actinobacillus succinogenes]|uniref:BolA family protein n=1 Tax=Actinobacillus succinogenes (strain ATCC 55618 / DSM 22257 / CCUG 43843 / 130Z) TaxID=339671 RepID=A6VLX5_ACTSZ|nr:BolA/IbaG family iron-sulfur metabolism protein [Actinobacillus succinogenes]ABR73972.1 BolA family protein [Actinobacillus succinogenes 130Z]PHI39586.1 transcriptional regulator [Actinobacillus succinogenes]